MVGNGNHGSENLLNCATRKQLELHGNKLSVHEIQVQDDSYRTPSSFLHVILEQTIGSRWNLLQKCCLFMPVLCASNLPQPQQTALSGTHFNMYHCYTALKNDFTEPVAPLITRPDTSKFLSFGLPERQSVREQISHQRSFES